MKLIPLRKFAEFGTAEIVKAVMENAPRGITVAEMRKRIRVLDSVEAADKLGLPAFKLEDADHATLASAIQNFEFSKATRDLVALIDDVVEAKEPPADLPASAEPAAGDA